MASEQKFGRRAETIEWVFAAVSTVIVLALMAYFLFEALAAVAEPPNFKISIVESYRTGTGMALVVEVENLGHAPAADVIVRAAADGTESSDVTIDYIGPGSTGQATFILAGSIASADDAGIRVTGFTAP